MLFFLQTEEFICLRMPAERGEEWRQEFMQVSQVRPCGHVL